MKKKLAKTLIFLMVVMFPVTILLSGCGATATNEARGVHFVSSKYDEETGYAIFEVDLNVATNLDYKVNPSSWSGYSVTYQPIGGDPANRVRYELINGVITVKSLDFQEIQIRIHINGHTDTCIVRLKEYPVKIQTNLTQVNINAFGVYTINVYGEFDDGAGSTYTRPITDNEFNFTIATSDETVIDVPNENRLKVCSVRRNSAAATVTVTLNDMQGESKGLSFTIHFNVVQNASSGYLLVSGYDKFVNNGDTIDINLSDLEYEEGHYVLSWRLYVFSESGRYTETTSSCTTNNSRYVEIDNDASTLFITTDGSLSLKVNIWTPLIDGDGNAFAVIFNINLK